MKTMIRSLAEIIQASDEALVTASLMKAKSLLVASEASVDPQVSELASLLREKLNSLDYENSFSIAEDLLAKFGEERTPEVTADLPFNNKERKKGPDPRTNGMYQPGRADWWGK